MKQARFYLTLLFAIAIAFRCDAAPQKRVIISEMDPFLQAILEAQEFLYMGSYKLHQHLLPNAQMAAAIQKVAQQQNLKDNVRLVLESTLTEVEQKAGDKSIQAGDSLKRYKELGIQLFPGSAHYHATHYKVLVSKDYGLVGTTNFDKDFNEGDTITRDFSIMLTEPALIQELKQVLIEDMLKKPFDIQKHNMAQLAEGGSWLSWGPEHHHDDLHWLINKATTSIEIYQQALQDKDMTELLLAAIKRGVKVRILMSEFPFGPKHGNKSAHDQQQILNAQGEVRLTGRVMKKGPLKGKRLHIHAKVIIVDGDNLTTAIMYLGSANFYTPALDTDRNVGLITRDMDYIQPVREQFLADWQAS